MVELPMDGMLLLMLHPEPRKGNARGKKRTADFRQHPIHRQISPRRFQADPEFCRIRRISCLTSGISAFFRF